jgi:hypothetical protein
VAYLATGRDGFARAAAVLPDPRSGALVIVARRDDAMLRALAETPWRGVPVVDVASRAGHHEGLGVVAVAAGAAAISEGRTGHVLVLGLAPDRWVTLVLATR